jgi:hypothetical protein
MKRNSKFPRKHRRSTILGRVPRRQRNSYQDAGYILASRAVILRT